MLASEADETKPKSDACLQLLNIAFTKAQQPYHSRFDYEGAFTHTVCYDCYLLCPLVWLGGLQSLGLLDGLKGTV